MQRWPPGRLMLAGAQASRARRTEQVEVKITEQISVRAAEFFHALTMVEDVHHEILEACNQLAALRTAIGTVRGPAAARAGGHGSGGDVP